MFNTVSAQLMCISKAQNTLIAYLVHDYSILFDVPNKQWHALALRCVVENKQLIGQSGCQVKQMTKSTSGWPLSHCTTAHSTWGSMKSASVH